MNTIETTLKVIKVLINFKNLEFLAYYVRDTDNLSADKWAA